MARIPILHFHPIQCPIVYLHSIKHHIITRNIHTYKPVLVWYQLHFGTIWLSIVRISLFFFFFFSFFLAVGYECLTFTLRLNHLSINMVKKGVDTNNYSCIQRFSHLDIATKYHHLTGITILMVPTGPGGALCIMFKNHVRS